jgi:di/tricarboxylate transporter
LIVAVASAFINNTPVVVMFIPVILSMGCRLGVSPSKLLIPISYVSILGGTCTLIGTSTNIIVSDLSAAYGYGAFGMFELSRVGLPLAMAGIALILVLSPRLMPDLGNPTCEFENQPKRRYLAEMIVPRGSALVGLGCEGLSNKYAGIEVVELIRYTHIYHPCRDVVAIAPAICSWSRARPTISPISCREKTSCCRNGNTQGVPTAQARPWYLN